MSEEVASAARQARRAELRSANMAAWESGGIESDGTGIRGKGPNAEAIAVNDRARFSGRLLEAEHGLHQAPAHFASCTRFCDRAHKGSQCIEFGKVSQRDYLSYIRGPRQVQKWYRNCGSD